MSGAEHEKNTERVIRGLKASIHNPRVSHEAKVHAEERLREMGQVIEPRESTSKATGTGRRRLGRKVRRASAASKPTEAIPAEEGGIAVGESKEPETEQRQEESSPHATEPTQPINKHEARVLRGYKATLSKKGVSEEAKRHATQVLQEHGAI